MSAHDSMMEPELEIMIDKLGSKFSLCTLASERAREINAYYNQLGGGVGTMVPPQVETISHKPLSIAFEEIADDKIVAIDKPSEDDNGEVIIEEEVIVEESE